MNLGATELILVLVIVLLLFGPSKLPTLGKSIGEAIRSFKKGMNEDSEKPAQIVREENHRQLDDQSADAAQTMAKKQEEKV